MSDCVISAGDTTWVLLSSVLVLTMMPALAFFESGMLRTKNTLSIVSQVFGGIIVLTTLWILFGYSLAFSHSYGGFIGDLHKGLFIDVSYFSCGDHSNTIPEAAFALFQMMFAVIAPLLVTGAYAERMKFSVSIVFSVLWELFIYYPVAHWVWGNGWLDKMGVLDFAGGIVLHTTAGTSALVVALMMGKRHDFDRKNGVYLPSNLAMAALGTGMLWAGWFGFNGGSALKAGGVAVSAVVSTQIGACCSGFVWLMLTWWLEKPSAVAVMNGAVAGLAGITPASGYINSPASIVLGFLLGAISYFGAHWLKHGLHIDDALEVTVIHGVTGAVGAIFNGFAADKDTNPDIMYSGVYKGSGKLLGIQVLAVVVTAAWTAVWTWLLVKFCEKCFGSIRVTAYEEDIGLDWVDHGEVAYHDLHVRKPTLRRNGEIRRRVTNQSPKAAEPSVVSPLLAEGYPINSVASTGGDSDNDSLEDLPMWNQP